MPPRHCGRQLQWQNWTVCWWCNAAWQKRPFKRPFRSLQHSPSTHQKTFQSSPEFRVDCSRLQLIAGYRCAQVWQAVYLYICTHTVYVSHISEANLCGWRALCKCCWIWSSSGGAAGHFVSSLIHMLSKHIFVHLTFCFTFLIFLICFDLLIHEIRSITKGRKRDHGRPANQAFDFDGMVVKRSKKDFQWLSCWISLLRSCFLSVEDSTMWADCEGQVQRDGFLHFRAGALQEAHQRRRVLATSLYWCTVAAVAAVAAVALFPIQWFILQHCQVQEFGPNDLWMLDCGWWTHLHCLYSESDDRLKSVEQSEERKELRKVYRSKVLAVASGC